MKKVFISHNSSDKPFVRALAQSLAEYGVNSWIDECEIKYGESLVQKISSAIEEIDIVIAVISSNSVQSQWVRQELDWAMTKEINKSKVVIIPLVIDKCDFPFFLKNKLYANFTQKNNYHENIAQLVDSINHHCGVTSPRKTDRAVNHANIGESVHIRYNPTNIPLILSGTLIFIALSLLSATLWYPENGHEIQNFEQLSGHVLVFSVLLIGLQLMEIVRLLFVRHIIRTDPVFANDSGMIQITSLLFKRYRKLILKYWSKNLIKVIVFIELGILMGILALGNYAFKIIDFIVVH